MDNYYSKKYFETRDFFPRYFAETFLLQLKSLPIKKILDVGCGTGISSGFDCFVAGIDPSIGLLRQNKNGKKILLTRISEPLSEVIWHPNNNNIIYVTKKSVNVIELDDREKYNITKLIELEKIERPILNKKGDILYFSAKIGNQEGIYKLYIQ